MFDFQASGTQKNKMVQEWTLPLPSKNARKNWPKSRTTTSVLFSRRFQEGVSFPNFVERSILMLPLSKLCAVPFALQNRALFEREKKAKRCQEKGKMVAGKGGKKEKKTCQSRSGIFAIFFRFSR